MAEKKEKLCAKDFHEVSKGSIICKESLGCMSLNNQQFLQGRHYLAPGLVIKTRDNRPW